MKPEQEIFNELWQEIEKASDTGIGEAVKVLAKRVARNEAIMYRSLWAAGIPVDKKGGEK